MNEKSWLSRKLLFGVYFNSMFEIIHLIENYKRVTVEIYCLYFCLFISNE